ncbi:MAG: GDP-mannose 4,6-dehydratase, partial [Pirellulaceae bacterium]
MQRLARLTRLDAPGPVPRWCPDSSRLAAYAILDSSIVCRLASSLIISSFMHILVTGGSGFIGSHLTDFLLERGDRVTVVDDLSTGRSQNLAHLAHHPQLQIIHADLGQAALVQECCQAADQVYHLAAAVGVALIAKRPYESIQRNIYPTQLVLEALTREHRRGRSVPLFLASTSEVYGKNPKPVWSEEDDLVFGATTKPRW